MILPMNYKLFLVFAMALVSVNDGVGEINAAKPPPAQTAAPESVPVAWIKNGRLLAYNVQGVESLPPTAFVYVAPGKTGRIALDGNPERISWIVRSELPDGVPFDFVAANIVSLLSGFGATERPVARGDVVEFLETADAALQNDPSSRSRIEFLLKGPEVIVKGKCGWTARYHAISGNSQIIWCVAEGTLVPFGVTRVSRYTLTAGSAERLTTSLLNEVIAAKERAQDAETAIADKLGE